MVKGMSTFLSIGLLKSCLKLLLTRGVVEFLCSLQCFHKDCAPFKSDLWSVGSVSCYAVDSSASAAYDSRRLYSPIPRLTSGQLSLTLLLLGAGYCCCLFFISVLLFT